jgi:hypothetical protein
VPTKIPEAVRDALTRFDKKADEIVNAFLATVEVQEAPPLIYHYTNDTGLRGVLESGEIWLSDIFYLNDPSELSHGYSHVVKILTERAAKGPEEAKRFADSFSSVDERGLEDIAHFFGASFSANGDELGQWRAYADNGRGYALGFDGKALEALFVRDNGVILPNNSTFPVTYNDAVLAGIHRQLVDEMFGLISLPLGKGMDAPAIRAYMIELSATLSMYALRSAMFFKHEAYKSEQEFRFLQVYGKRSNPPTDVRRRYRSHELVKYRTFRWKRPPADALKRIVIGPSSDTAKAPRFVRDCLDAYGVTNVEITRSKIPYRAQ